MVHVSETETHVPHLVHVLYVCSFDGDMSETETHVPHLIHVFYFCVECRIMGLCFVFLLVISAYIGNIVLMDFRQPVQQSVQIQWKLHFQVQKKNL